MISQLLTELSRRMGLGSAFAEHTTGIDFEVDGRYAISLEADSESGSLVIDCAVRGVTISDGEALNLLRYNLAAVRRDGIFVACNSKDGTLHLVKRLHLTPATGADEVVELLQSVLDAADRWSAPMENETGDSAGGLISEMSRFA